MAALVGTGMTGPETSDNYERIVGLQRQLQLKPFIYRGSCPDIVVKLLCNEERGRNG